MFLQGPAHLSPNPRAHLGIRLRAQTSYYPEEVLEG